MFAVYYCILQDLNVWKIKYNTIGDSSVKVKERKRFSISLPPVILFKFFCTFLFGVFIENIQILAVLLIKIV